VVVHQETLLEAEKNIQDKLSRYTNVIDFEQSPTHIPQPLVAPTLFKSLYLQSVISKLRAEEIQAAAVPALPSAAHLEAKVALKRVEELKVMMGEDAPSLKDVTFEALQKSADLRTLILDYTMSHWD